MNEVEMKLTSLSEGCRDALNGWVDEKRVLVDKAYAGGVCIGRFRYEQFSKSTVDHFPGHVFAEPPAALFEPFLPLLLTDPNETNEPELGEEFEPLTDKSLSSSPVANWPFGRSFDRQLDCVTGPNTQILHVALC